jgi:hypothetical protein
MRQAQSVTLGWDLSDGIQPYALIASMSPPISDIVPFSWYDDKLKGPPGQVPGCQGGKVAHEWQLLRAANRCT